MDPEESVVIIPYTRVVIVEYLYSKIFFYVFNLWSVWAHRHCIRWFLFGKCLGVLSFKDKALSGYSRHCLGIV